MKTDDIELNLLQNAIDSIEQSIEMIAWNDEKNTTRRYKRSISAISHGIELLFKERLYRIHPALIWENVDKYPDPTAKTISLDTAILRLSKIGSIKFSKTDSTLIISLKNIRNKIEHYKWAIPKSEANNIIGHALAFSIFFLKEHLDTNIFGYEIKGDDTLEQLLNSNAEFKKYFEDRNYAEQFQTELLECKFCRAIAVNYESKMCNVCGEYHPYYDGHWEYDLNENPF